MITEHTVESLQEFENDIAASFNAGRIRAPIHLSSGNEQQLLDIFEDVRPGDWVATTWRSHLHCLLKGVPPEQLKADILAGKSITLTYPEYRIISSAIVGGVLPIAVGLAWAIKRAGFDDGVWAFCGDMTAHGGMFHECRQYAAGHDLPIIFVVEDNGLSVCTDTATVWGSGEHRPPLGPRQKYCWLPKHKLSWPHSGAGKRIQF